MPVIEPLQFQSVSRKIEGPVWTWIDCSIAQRGMAEWLSVNLDTGELLIQPKAKTGEETTVERYKHCVLSIKGNLIGFKANAKENTAVGIRFLRPCGVVLYITPPEVMSCGDVGLDYDKFMIHMNLPKGRIAAAPFVIGLIDETKEAEAQPVGILDASGQVCNIPEPTATGQPAEPQVLLAA